MTAPPSDRPDPEHAHQRWVGDTRQARNVHVLVVALGDLLLLFAFAFVGRRSHHEVSGNGLLGTIGTATPFFVGWLLAAPILGAYDTQARSNYRSAPIRVLRSWVVALATALLIRAAVERRLPPVSFALVAFFFNLFTLSVWRLAIVAYRAVKTSDAT